ncbi:MAG: cytochrome c maturation protein CcmE [Chitinophagales bacterium]
MDKEGKEVFVICFDDMPTDFEKSEDIVLTGSMKENTFYADEMLVKCPSKYQENEIQK